MMASADCAYSNARDQLLRKGVRVFLPASRRLCGIRHIRRAMVEATEHLGARGHAASREALGSILIACLVCLSVLSLLLTRSVVGAVAVPVCFVSLFLALLAMERESRNEALRESVPEALQSMGSCFHSGLSLLQTFHQVSMEIEGPLGVLFKRAAYRLETGGTVEESLSILEEGGSSELAFVAIALDVQHEAGGSMKQVLDAARETVEGQIDLARTLRVQTAQAKLSARVVSLMPFILIALFSLISPDFLKPFFSSATGLALLVLALGMQLAGVLLVRRMLAVEVR